MRKTYATFPLDRPHPCFKNEKSYTEPHLNVKLGNYKHVVGPRFSAVVDSGSPWCIFRAEFAEMLGLKPQEGAETQQAGIISGVTEPIYFHKVRLYVETDWIIDVVAGFMKKLGTSGILGRSGFFDNFHVHFDHSCRPPVVEITKIERPN